MTLRSSAGAMPVFLRPIKPIRSYSLFTTPATTLSHFNRQSKVCYPSKIVILRNFNVTNNFPTNVSPGPNILDPDEDESPKEERAQWRPTLFKMFESAVTTLASVAVLGSVIKYSACPLASKDHASNNCKQPDGVHYTASFDITNITHL